MFFVHDIIWDIRKNRKCGIVDTDDWSKEYYREKELVEISKSIKIRGVQDGKVERYDLLPVIQKSISRLRLAGLFPTNLGVVQSDFCIRLVSLNKSNIETGKKLRIPDGVEKIESFLFQGNTILEQVDLPLSITVIPTSCFVNCTFLKSVKMSNRVMVIDDSAFAYCYALERINFGSDLRHINDNAFKECSNLRSVVFSDGLTSIGDFCFQQCTSLEEVDIPQSVEALGTCCFSNCTALRRVHLSGEINMNQGVFLKCSALEEVDMTHLRIGNDILPEFCFSGCASLRHIDIPQVHKIGKGAFRGVGLRTVVIPHSVSIIQDYAISGCSNLRSIKFEGGREVGIELQRGCFSSCTSLRRIKLPKIVSMADGVFAGCDNLEEIEFEGGGSVDFVRLAGLTSLRRIVIHHHPETICTQKSAIKTLVNLEEVVVSKDDEFYDSYVEAFGVDRVKQIQMRGGI